MANLPGPLGDKYFPLRRIMLVFIEASTILSVSGVSAYETNNERLESAKSGVKSEHITMVSDVDLMPPTESHESHQLYTRW
jgi:hypothetical protein